MKRLLLLTSATVLLLIFGCQLGKKSQTSDNQPKSDTELLESKSKDDLSWREKRRLRKLNKKQEAPNHGSPDQHEIDSIKNAKSKLKGQ